MFCNCISSKQRPSNAPLFDSSFIYPPVQWDFSQALMQFLLHALPDDTLTTHLGLSGNQNSVSVQDTVNHFNCYGQRCSLRYLNMVQNVQQKYEIRK